MSGVKGEEWFQKRVDRGTVFATPKLDEAQVLEIRRIYNDDPKATKVSLSKQFGVGERAIRSILNYTSWRHI